MKRLGLICLIFLFLLAGCTQQAAMESVPSTGEDRTEPAEESQETFDAQISHTFVLWDDSLEVPVKGIPPIAGVPYEAGQDAQDFLKNVEQAIVKQGVLPGYAELQLWIAGELPTEIEWYVEKGGGFLQKAGTIRVQFRSVILPLYDAQDFVLGFGAERIVRIVCRYPTRQVEYVMVLDPLL